MKRVAVCLLVSALIVTACHRNNTDQTHDALAALTGCGKTRRKTIAAKGKHYYDHESGSWINVVRGQKSFFRNLLKSNTPNQQYGPAFWSDEYQRKTDLWQRALAFCNQPAHQDSANCQAVLSQKENSSAKRWMERGTNVPFGLQPQATGSPNH